ncbi:MAG: hypothetical protein BMS9Abin32_655 [Gammaproteobacteria bacterium]|nr:MAG: hypothetical protein BMS9Abin32_655 [Gammaproteobacteria bacterium]
MIKTFIFGILLGLGGTAALLHFAPVVDQKREASLSIYKVNVGSSESFYINLPYDRILAGIPGQEASVPAGLQWPQDAMFAGSQAELFKLRDRNDYVIGLASRIAYGTRSDGGFIQWMLHFPARGTMFVPLGLEPAADGNRHGRLRSGTREFAALSGTVTERFIAQVTEAGTDTNARIELVAELVGPQVVDE